jgi:acyl-CoA synthetase (NDP forming)
VTRSALDRLLAPRSVAVVGASQAPKKAGHALVRNLAGFDGDVHAVNPRAGEIAGRPAVGSVAEIPGLVDLALLAVPPPALAGAVRDCAAAGVGGVVVHTGGLGEASAAGAALQDELLAIARGAGMRLLGPNTSGFVSPPAGLCASFVPGAVGVPAGGLAIIAQSGGVNHQLAFHAQAEGVGVHLAVGLGNAIDVDAADLLEHLADDPAVAVVALALEGIRSGRALFEAVARVSARVPVVALKTGRTDVGAFAQSHTGALLGSFRVARAALRQAGAVVVEDVTELIDAARTLAAGRLPPLDGDGGVAVVTGQAGPGLLLADALGAARVRLPELGKEARAQLSELLDPITYQANPVDTGRPGATFGEVVRIVAQAPGIDAVAVHALLEPGALDPVAALPGAASVPVVFSTAGPPDEMARVRADLEQSGIVTLPTPERAARALAARVADGRARGLRRRGRRGTAGPSQTVAAAVGPPWDEVRAKELLAELGIRSPARVLCDGQAAAHEAFVALRPPLAVKLVHPQMTHKTEQGAVHLGVRDVDELDAALAALARVEGFAGARILLEQMAAPGPELILGASRDASFGVVVLLGAGGVAAEAVDDVAVRLAPVAPEEAQGMLEELASAALFRGFRGLPAVDELELARAIAAVGALMVARPDVGGLDVNPLRVTANGLLALDAMVLPA